MDISKEGKVSQQKSHIKTTENKSEAGTSSKSVENGYNNNENGASASVHDSKTNTDNKRGKKEIVEVDSQRQSSQFKKVEDCPSLNLTNEGAEHLGKEIHLKNEEPKASSSKMMAQEHVDRLMDEGDELEAAGQQINQGSDEYFQKSNKGNQKIGTPKKSFREREKDNEDEDEGSSNKDCKNIKAATQEMQKTFSKREGTAGISGQLYEIYLVLLVLLQGLTNKNITNFHLASNLKEAGDFDDVVFSYTYKDHEGVERIKVTFLQAKHRQKTKYISLEELLGKTEKGDFNLKKYFKSFRKIKQNFEEGNRTDPIFGRHFNECEFIFYTNCLFKIGHTEEVYIDELPTEEEWILNINEERTKYYQLHFSKDKNKNDRIKKFLERNKEIEMLEFQEFLSKLKICSAQPNEKKLKGIIKDQIHLDYGVTRSDVKKTVFPIVKTKIEKWWKNENSSEYLTKDNRFIQIAASLWIRFEVQDPIPEFTGREQPLRELHKALQSRGHCLMSHSVSITGLGGIGKTELARKYISQYSQHYDNNIIWINAEDYVTCSESFRKLAGDILEIGIQNRDGKDKDITSIKSEVYAFFAKRNKKSLFIFDNAENHQDTANANKEENVRNFLPSGDNKPYVLITSQNQQWRGIKSLQLDLFTEKESAQFIKKYLNERKIKWEETEINSLCEILQYLPLALRQAVAYIAMETEMWNESYTIGQYLDGFGDKLLGKASQDVFDVYSETVLTTWQVTIDKIKRNEIYGMHSELILNIIAFFAPNNIPIITIFGRLIGEENIRGSVKILNQYSLVKLQGGEVSIHRLLQQVIRMMLQNEGKYINIIEKTLRLFDDDIHSNCIMHMRSVWDYAKNLKQVVEKFSWVPLLITKKLVDAKKYTDAYSFVTMTQKLFKDKLGDSHRDTLMSLHWKADILHKQGKYNDAVLVFQELLCKRNKTLGPDHPDTLETIDRLVSVRKMQRKYKEWLIFFHKVLFKYKETLGSNYPNTFTTTDNVASLLDNHGHFEKSLIQNQEELCKQKEILEPDHPDTLSTKQENYENSLIQNQEELFKHKGMLGPDHYNILTTKHNMALLLHKQEKYGESLILYQEILGTQKEMLGPDHPNTLITMHNMAYVFDKLGNYEKSVILYQKVLCKQKKILGPDHLNTLTTMHNMANVFDKQGQYKKSFFLYQKVLCKQAQMLGSDHPNTLILMHNLASSLYSQGKYQESSILYQKVLCAQMKILGPDHPNTLTTKHNMALVLDKQGKYDESLILYEEVLCTQKEMLGADHPNTLTTLRNMDSASPRKKISRLKRFLKRIFRRPH